MLCRAVSGDHADGAGSGDGSGVVVGRGEGAAMSWQHPPPEVDAERQWREAITHAVMEIADKLGACQHHGPRVAQAWRHLELQRDWMQDTGGET